MGAGAGEHDRAVQHARTHLADDVRAGRRHLESLPDGFAAARNAIHRIAESTLQEKRRVETGSGFLSPFTPGGIGTPPWEHGIESGTSGIATIEGDELVLIDGDRAERTTIQGADPAATNAIVAFNALATAALATLIERAGVEADPIRLWPEHFDVATVLGEEGNGERANYGASPGDEQHPEPYLYVGPFDPPGRDTFWNANGFTGAELGYSELLQADDQLGAATDFYERGHDLLRRASGSD